jgi:hypothetical protein
MRITRIISTALLSFLLSIASAAYAQEQHDEKHHADKQDGKQEQAKPSPQHAQEHRQSDRGQQQEHAQQQQRNNENKQQQHAQQQRQDQNNRQEHAQQQQRNDENRQQQHAQQERQDQYKHNNRQEGAQRQRSNDSSRRPEHHRIQQSAWQEHRSQRWDSDHRSWQQRGGYHGYRVPDDRYRGYFGPEHGFRIGILPFEVVRGYPRFQYNGYWISAVDPWPEYWGDNWYDNDDVYVAYVDNGYYMYNRRYPNAGVAISISF